MIHNMLENTLYILYVYCLVNVLLSALVYLNFKNKHSILCILVVIFEERFGIYIVIFRITSFKLFCGGKVLCKCLGIRGFISLENEMSE